MTSATAPEDVNDPQPEPKPEPKPQASAGVARATLRIWPAWLIVIVATVLFVGVNALLANTFAQFMVMMWGPGVLLLSILGWWLFASRAPGGEKLLITGLTIACMLAAGFLQHRSMLEGMAYPIYAPMAVAALMTLAATVCMFAASLVRGLVLAACVIVATFGWTALRLEGVSGKFEPSFALRTSPTVEDSYESFLAGQNKAATVDVTNVVLEEQPADTIWPGFRGENRNSVVEGVKINKDLTQMKELWRRPIGLGWGSFAVVGDLIYTQEQRGEDEVVVCLDAGTGNEVWAFSYPARFYEALAGAGPRATPTYFEGKIYTIGAKGDLYCLDALTGEDLWHADIMKDAEAELPIWAFACSPLIYENAVIVQPAGKLGALVAYDRLTGEVLWKGGDGSQTYGSPQFAEIDGQPQILSVSGKGLSSVDPKTGDEIWNHAWDIGEFARIVQPSVLPDGNVLLGSGFGYGTQRLDIKKDDKGWNIKEVWLAKRLSPYFNDFVIYGDHFFGLESGGLVCLSLQDGKRVWRGGRYGAGQLLLFKDQGLLLVLSEKGELVLVPADPTGHKELSKIQAIEGKTWNHPAIAGGRLFVRNGEEAACYELAK